MTTEKIAYEGKKVFIGIDVHRRNYAVCCICEGIIVKRCTMRAEPSKVVEFVKKNFEGGNIFSVYEAGFSGFVLHRYLESYGIKNIVVHAGSIEVAVRDTTKCDKRDSKKLAEHLAAGRLRGIRVPSEEEERRRLLTRTREQLIRGRARIKNQIRMKLHQFGMLDPEYEQVLTKSFIELILQGELPSELRMSVKVLCAQWTTIELELKELERELRNQAEHDSLEEVYRSVPGIGPHAARVLSNELGDMSQFPNERTLFSFTGLTPREFSSGERRRLGHISRQGSGRIRHILVEAAWVAIRQDSVLATDFKRISLRAGKKRAIVAIARKLIGRIRAILRTQGSYQLAYKLAA